MGYSNEDKEELISNYIESYGVVTDACKATNIHRDTFYRWKKEDESFADKIEQADEKIRDKVETMFIEKDLKNKYSARKFWLKRRHPAYRETTSNQKKSEEDSEGKSNTLADVMKKALKES